MLELEVASCLILLLPLPSAGLVSLLLLLGSHLVVFPMTLKIFVVLLVALAVVWLYSVAHC